jgi:hypothetical protein
MLNYKELPINTPTKAVHSVKSLSINLDLSLDSLIDLMRLFPCLEKLHAKVVIPSLIISHLL